MAKGAKEFIDEVSRNPQLRQQIYKQSHDAVHALAKQHGFEFTPEELHNALHNKLSVVPEAADVGGASGCVVVIVVAAARR